MASSKLSCWAVYYNNHQVILSALFLLISVMSNWAHLLLPTTLWLAYSLYTTFGTTEIPGSETFSAIIVGAGFSGIEMARRLKEAGIKYVILEKSSGVGGTWHDNAYPGIGCDIMSHFYSLSTLPNPFWSRGLSSGEEIRRYLDDTADHFGAKGNTRFNTEVREAVWLEGEQEWEVITGERERLRANFLVDGTGRLHVPVVPEFKGRMSFTGTSFHTAKWPKGYDLSGKRVAVVGTGASAVQLIPVIADDVKALTVYQRTPSWVANWYDWNNYHYPQWMKFVFAAFPPLLTLHRYSIFWFHEGSYQFLSYTKKNFFQSCIRRLIYKWMEFNLLSVQDPEVRRRLTPSYEIGCKRISQSPTFMKTFNKPYVELVTEKVEEITPTGIRSGDGKDREMDVIIYATGFDLVRSSVPFKMTGTKGKDLETMMGDAPAAMNGVTVPNFPNFFILNGPNAVVGHNSVIFMIECQSTYIISCMKKMIEAGGQSLECRTEALRSWLEYVYDECSDKVWTSGCMSYHMSEKGVVHNIWPKTVLEYWWRLLKCDIADFKLSGSAPNMEEKTPFLRNWTEHAKHNKMN